MQWISSEIKLKKHHCTRLNPKPYSSAYYISGVNTNNNRKYGDPDNLEQNTQIYSRAHGFLGEHKDCCKVGCLVFFSIFFLFFLIYHNPFCPLLLACHTCITIGSMFHLLQYSISFNPCSTPILLSISRHKLVTINLSSFSLTAHDEPVCVS